jgi:presenilin-like A22 family membrane protease
VLLLGAVLLLLTHKIFQTVDTRIWVRLLIYGVLVAVVGRVALHSQPRKRIITLLLAFVMIAMAYTTAALLGYGLDVLAVTVILIAHDMYDRHLEKREHILQQARGTNA